MFHKIKNVSALPEYKLSVQFSEGVTKIYDVKPLFQRIPAFKLLESGNDFGDVYVDVGLLKVPARNVRPCSLPARRKGNAGKPKIVLRLF